MLKCNLLIRNLSRQFRISMGRLSNDVFHIQDEDDFQKQIIDSRKLFLVGFHASW